MWSHLPVSRSTNLPLLRLPSSRVPFGSLWTQSNPGNPVHRSTCICYLIRDTVTFNSLQPIPTMLPGADISLGSMKANWILSSSSLRRLGKSSMNTTCYKPALMVLSIRLRHTLHLGDCFGTIVLRLLGCENRSFDH